MTTKRHMSTNIEGLLRHMKGKKINFIDDDNGKTMSDKEARAAIAELQAKGHKLIPSVGCEGFDPFGGGCPGHPVLEVVDIISAKIRKEGKDTIASFEVEVEVDETIKQNK